LLDGFGEKAERYIDQLREHARSMAVLRYGFQFRKTDLSEQTLRDSIDSVINRTRRKVESKANRSARSFTAWMTRGKLPAQVHY
jgi:hypothetical protein